MFLNTKDKITYAANVIGTAIHLTKKPATFAMTTTIINGRNLLIVTFLNFNANIGSLETIKKLTMKMMEYQNQMLVNKVIAQAWLQYQ